MRWLGMKGAGRVGREEAEGGVCVVCTEEFQESIVVILLSLLVGDFEDIKERETLSAREICEA
jgi:hypothetical protein